MLLVLALSVIWIKLARSRNDPREDLVRYAALTLAVALVLGTVLSAQYITWLVPLVPLVAGRRGAAATLAFVVAAALTHVWFPSGWYGNYLAHFDVAATSILSARNLALVVCALVLALPSRAALGRLLAPEPRPNPQAPRTSQRMRTPLAKTRTTSSKGGLRNQYPSRGRRGRSCRRAIRARGVADGDLRCGRRRGMTLSELFPPSQRLSPANRDFMEAAGIEPASADAPDRTSTSVVRALASTAGRRRTPYRRSSHP